ncbi:activator-dependent family glycosyltransferase [Nonomuraea sp. NPDC051941]|uniref:activator-dependent family glycosyltransferase n=1 Tax=Nonomuraea sp. NPDC051941 TaxID=3364373 RepID=UPI0037C703BB
MRVLFASYPEKPVFQYLVTLAWALRTAGHEVRFASQANFAGVINQAGLTAQPAGDNPEPWRLTHLSAEQREEERPGLPAPYDVVDNPGNITWPYLRDGYAGPVVGRYVMESLPMIPDLLEFARAWRPDLVVWEPNCYAGPLAAKVSGAAHARLLFGLDIFGLARTHFLRLRADQPAEERVDPLAQWFDKQLAPYGEEFTEDLATGHFTVDQFPASLAEPAADLRYLRMQYIPYGGPAIVPGWLQDPPRKPRVGLTMGLSATDHFGGYTIGLQDVLDALAGLDIEVVATVADKEKAKLARIPANTRVIPYVPLHALAPTCSAVIHHAGAATMATVSRYGVPQLALHLHFDQPALARRLAGQGAGLAIANDEATGDAVAAAVRRLLTEPAFTERATALAEEIRRLPSPNQLVTEIEQLTAEHRNS